MGTIAALPYLHTGDIITLVDCRLSMIGNHFAYCWITPTYNYKRFSTEKIACKKSAHFNV